MPLSAYSVDLDICRINLDCDPLANEVHVKDQTCVPALPNQSPNDTLQWPMFYFNHCALAEQRTGVIAQIRRDKATDAFYLVRRNRR